MKRVWVASLASLLVASIPIATSFADTEQIDKLTVNVSESCTLTRDASDTSNDGTNGAGVYIDSLLPGETTTFSNRHSVFAVTCNYTGGFSVKTTFKPLEDTTNNGTDIIYSSTTPSTGSGTWTATVVSQTVDTVNNTPHNIAVTSSDATNDHIKYGILMSRAANSAISNATYTIQYTVAPSSNQAAGTYTGSAEYTLSKNT